jgi:hypothetical protein
MAIDIPTSAEALAGITIAKAASIKELVKVRFKRDCINPPFTAWHNAIARPNILWHANHSIWGRNAG